MSTLGNSAASRRLIEEGFNQGRLQVYDEVCAPQYVTHDPADTADVQGITANKERCAAYRTAFPDLRITVDDLIAADDKVVMRWTASGTHKGPLIGIAATNRRCTITGTTIDRYDAAGRLSETWDQWDNLGMLTQLGLVPQGAMAAR